MLTAEVHPTTWHSQPALQIENAGLSLVVVPAAGSKIVSLYDKQARYEWLISPDQSHPFAVHPYGTAYDPNEPGGWDEMLPTIIPTSYPAPGPWQGASLPDHGEAWTLPWSVVPAAADQVVLTVAGQALPYRLTRAISCPGPAEVRLAYQLENLAQASLHYLWAAHPQFACETGAVIELPAEVTEVINVLPREYGVEFGEPGTANAWPVMPGADGTALRQDLVAGPELRRGRKFYLPPERPIAWAGLRQLRAGCSLRLAWDPAQVPYCGVWIDEGFLNTVSDVALEPTNGYYDDLTAAWRAGRVGQLAPGGLTAWELAVHLDHEC